MPQLRRFSAPFRQWPALAIATLGLGLHACGKDDALSPEAEIRGRYALVSVVLDSVPIFVGLRPQAAPTDSVWLEGATIELNGRTGLIETVTRFGPLSGGAARTETDTTLITAYSVRPPGPGPYESWSGEFSLADPGQAVPTQRIFSYLDGQIYFNDGYWVRVR